jgi:hypothetical protein
MSEAGVQAEGLAGAGFFGAFLADFFFGVFLAAFFEAFAGVFFVALVAMR